MKSKNTTALAREHEEHIAKVLGGQRSRSSGSSLGNFIDVTTPDEVAECEATESKSISVKLATWIEVREKAYGGRRPIYPLRFRDPMYGKVTDLVVIDLNDYLELTEKAWKYDSLD